MNSYGCDILGIKIESERRVRYLLSWAKDDCCVKRDNFELSRDKIVHDRCLGFKTDESGKRISQRRQLPTRRLFDEMIEFKIYNEKIKDFNRAIVNNGAKKGQATKKLCEICEEVYKNVQDCNNDKSKWLGEHGGGLMEEDVVKILVRYNMYNPDLSMIDRMKGITSKQGWAWKRHIMKVEVKSFNITYVFLRQYMTLYTAEMTKEQSKSQEDIYAEESIYNKFTQTKGCVN